MPNYFWLPFLFFLFFFRSTLMTNLWRAARRTFGMRHNAAIKWWLIIITPISTSHSEACLVLAHSKINIWMLPVESVNLCNVSFGGPLLCKICFDRVFIRKVFFILKFSRKLGNRWSCNLSMVSPCLHAMTAGKGSSQCPATLSAGQSRYWKWKNA